MVPHTHDAPLAGCRVVECAGTPAAAYAARMLATMGACVTMLEPPGQGSPLRQLPPRLDGGRGESALFAYLAAGKRSVACDLASPQGQAVLARELAQADILIEDTPLADRAALGLAPDGPKGHGITGAQSRTPAVRCIARTAFAGNCHPLDAAGPTAFRVVRRTSPAAAPPPR